MDRRERKPPTLAEVVATLLTFRRLLVIWGIVPLIVAASPFVAGLYLVVMNFVTSGSGFLSTLLTTGVTLIGRHAIIIYAPSWKQRDDALSDSQMLLPLAAFVFSRVIISGILSPIATWLGFQGVILFSPKPPYTSSLLLAAWMLLLGAAVLFRFVGPVSVGKNECWLIFVPVVAPTVTHSFLPERCSSVPLRSDPASSFMRYFWERCTSFGAFLGLVASPNPPPGGELIRWRETGFRYSSPSIRATVGQVLFSLVIGFILPHFLPTGHHYAASDPLVKVALIATCVFAILTNTVFSSLFGSSHELDPKHYQSIKPQETISFQQFPSLRGKFAWSFISVPSVSMSVAYHSDYSFYSWMEIRNLLTLALVVTVLINIYMIFVYEASRTVLCMPGMNPDRFVEELSEPRESTMYVMLESILHGSVRVMRSVSEPRAGVLYAEDEELKRGDACMRDMANVLLGLMDRDPRSSQACLERDILRVSLLESLGGTATGDAANPELINATRRHVKRWAHPNTAVWAGVARGEPDAALLVRALSAYAGGLGTALQICSLPPTDPRRLALDETSMFTTWSLPPGARACSEWSIRAAARLIVYSFGPTEESASDWRNSSLSMLVPAMIHAAFSLRKGILQFGSMSHGKHAVVSDAVDIDWIAGENKLLRPIVLACDEAALLVVSKLSTGANRANIRVHDDESRQWLEDLSKSTSF
jgi:hypothetical protein